MKLRSPFDDEAKRRELLERLNQIGKVNVPADSLARWPTFPLAALTDEADMQRVLNTLDWYVREVTAA